MLRKIAHIARPILDRFPTLATALRYVRDSRNLSSAPVQTPFGFKLVGNKTMQNGSFEPEETRLLLGLMRQCDVVIDVGANIGYYCCLALNEGKKVIAFEAIWLNAKYLLKNVTLNGWQDELELHLAAASNKVGVIDIFGGGTGASLLGGWGGTPEHYRSLVPTTTLDIVLGERLGGCQALVIIDVEGAEKMVLEGAASLLQNDPKPVFMIEIVINQKKGIGHNPHLLSTFEVMWNAGYEAFTADDQCREVTRTEVEKISETGLDTLRTYNFLFIENGRKADFLSN